MEYRSLNKYLIPSIIFALTGCNSMNIKNEKDQADIEIYSSSDLTYKGINEYFGYKDQNNYYINLTSKDPYENKDDKFIKIGKFISSEPTDKIKIKLVERDIKANHNEKYPPNSGTDLYLNKLNKRYRFPFTTESDKAINLQGKVMVNIHDFKSKIYKSYTSCESCFEPSVTLSKNGQDYVFNLILKNMGSNDFELDGISTLTNLSIFLDEEIIELDKSNLLNNNYLDEITVLKNDTVIIPFVIHSNEIPKSIRNKDLTKEKLKITMLSTYKSGELDNKYFNFTLYNKVL